ncbi:sensor histidine kinase [Flintibacter muris]|uniref:sensor histidine kinase n=1 Tax=Flintibacter muris TaxID=2941327 RepID=UPI00203D9E55|nr:HAMP domain-containing sensor histidine kinase [Flintibacter muris]
MPRKRHRFQTPPPADPIAAARDSSLALRLNVGFFLRQLGIFAAMDLLLVVLAVFGMSLYAENRCAEVVDMVNVRGVPSEDALAWMEASDYTITPLDRDPEGLDYTVTTWLPTCRRETVDGLRTWNFSSFYTVEMHNNGQPYAVTVDTSGIFTGLYWAGVVILVCQGLSLITNLFRSGRSIRKVLRPIQDLAATAARLNSMTHMSRREIESLAGELDKIDAAHLDSRIDLPPTQKELRSLAQSINEMMDRVNQAYSAQMRFVSDASHELRTPIAVIQGYAALLDRWGKTDPEALQESIDAIRGEAASMERLVEQLLFLARGDNDSQPVKMEPLDLTDLAGEVLREEEMIHPERIFLPRWGEDPVSIYADPGLMKQVLRILMDNSLKYSPPEGRVYLRVSRSGENVRVTVQDEGMGIPPEGIPLIFDRFYRTDLSRDRKTGGTGLGLSIAKWIVERHGGWFEVVSRPDVGTRITVVLPALREEEKAS